MQIYAQATACTPSAAPVKDDPPQASLAARTIRVIAATAIVVLVYALPLVSAHYFQRRLLYAETPDDSFYTTRVLELVRGGTLGNPYLPEHVDAPRFMPELVEHLLAWSTRATGLAPLHFIALTRLLFPAVIFLLAYHLARGLDLEMRMAAMVGYCTVFSPSLSPGGYTLRYFRVISPAAYIVMVMIALLLIERLWRNPVWFSACLTGIGVGMLFYAPVYYWSFVLVGLGVLASLSRGEVRVALFASGALAVLLGAPSLLHSARLSGDPVVREALARLGLMVPGRHLEPEVLTRLLLGALLASVACCLRGRQFRWAAFVLPFAIAGCFMLIQNVLTNRQFQAYHMINCLMPLAAFVVVGCLQACRIRQEWYSVGLIILIVAGIAVQISGYRAWSRKTKSEPEQYALNSAFPRTLAWLNEHTSPHSVVLFPEAMSAAAPLFTTNSVYLGRYFFQYVMSNSELRLRSETQRNWTPGAALPYHADYVLVEGERCPQWGAAAVFRDLGEGTCIFRIIPYSGRILPPESPNEPSTK